MRYDQGSGGGPRVARAIGGFSARSQLDAPRDGEGRGTLERRAAFVNFLATLGEMLVILLLTVVSTWPAIGTGASLREIRKRSGRVRTEEIRLSGLDVEHQYSLLYSISTLDGLGSWRWPS